MQVQLLLEYTWWNHSNTARTQAAKHVHKHDYSPQHLTAYSAVLHSKGFCAFQCCFKSFTQQVYHPLLVLLFVWLLVFTLRKCLPNSYTDTSLVLAFRKGHRCLSVHTLTHMFVLCFPATVWAHLLLFPLLVPRPPEARCFESLRSFYVFANCFYSFDIWVVVSWFIVCLFTFILYLSIHLSTYLSIYET